jgi:hypothetical protein
MSKITVGENSAGTCNFVMASLTAVGFDTYDLGDFCIPPPRIWSYSI